MNEAQHVFKDLSTSMRLHSDRIGPADADYRLETLSRLEELDPVYTCYRATRNRVECSMKNPFVVPMTVADIRRRLDEFPSANRAAFLDYVARFTHQAGPLELTLPAYGLGEAGYLLLDGNHRATAVAIAGRPFTITLAVLDGPIDRRILRDLKFWDGGWRRFARRIKAGRTAR